MDTLPGVGNSWYSSAARRSSVRLSSVAGMDDRLRARDRGARRVVRRRIILGFESGGGSRRSSRRAGGAQAGGLRGSWRRLLERQRHAWAVGTVMAFRFTLRSVKGPAAHEGRDHHLMPSHRPTAPRAVATTSAAARTTRCPFIARPARVPPRACRSVTSPPRAGLGRCPFAGGVSREEDAPHRARGSERRVRHDPPALRPPRSACRGGGG